MMPSLVAIGTYSLLLAWNSSVCVSLLSATGRSRSALRWAIFWRRRFAVELLMTVGVIYALPPAAIYYTFRYMVTASRPER
jgi:multiple sugar transport system permease protein